MLIAAVVNRKLKPTIVFITCDYIYNGLAAYDILIGNVVTNITNVTYKYYVEILESLRVKA